MGKFHFLAGWVRGIILRLYYIYVCGDGQAAMWWWPLRLYCHLLGQSNPQSHPQSQSLDNNICLLNIFRS